MGSPLSFFACIGTMNQIGTPLPALSPQGGERLAAGRERGRFMGREQLPTTSTLPRFRWPSSLRRFDASFDAEAQRFW